MPSDASNRVGAGLGSAPFCMGGTLEKKRWGFAPSPENSHSRAVLCLRQTRSLRFPISTTLNPAHRARGSNPQTLSGDQSPDPIFASRRFESSLSDDAHARRMPKTIQTAAKRIGKSRNLRFLVGLGAKPQTSSFPPSGLLYHTFPLLQSKPPKFQGFVFFC